MPVRKRNETVYFFKKEEWEGGRGMAAGRPQCKILEKEHKRCQVVRIWDEVLLQAEFWVLQSIRRRLNPDSLLHSLQLHQAAGVPEQAGCKNQNKRVSETDKIVQLSGWIRSTFDDSPSRFGWKFRWRRVRGVQEMCGYIRSSSSWIVQWLAYDLRFHRMALRGCKGGSIFKEVCGVQDSPDA